MYSQKTKWQGHGRQEVTATALTTSKQGLGREARAALLRVRIWPECPKHNLSKLTWDSKPD